MALFASSLVVFNIEATIEGAASRSMPYGSRASATSAFLAGSVMANLSVARMIFSIESASIVLDSVDAEHGGRTAILPLGDQHAAAQASEA